MIKARIALALATALIVALPVSAGVREDMDRMFNSSMVHVNRPDASMSMRRGIISGGSITVRNRNVSTGPWVQIDPPFVATGAGCGGFDLNFGALSHISTDQLEQLLRSIPSAAVAYAFELGLSSVSPQIHSLVSKYASMVNEFGAKYSSSCQIAQTLMDDSGLSGQIRTGSQSLATALGLSRDQLESTNAGIGEDTAATRLARSNPQALARMSPGNIIWKALKLKRADGWVEGGDDTLLQDIMSLTGTYVACYPGVQGCPFARGSAASAGAGAGAPEDEEIAKSRYYPPVLSLAALVDGTTAADGSQGATRVQALRCDGSTALPEGCLSPAIQDVPITPMRERVLRVVRGEPGNDADGIIGRMRAGGTDPTESERVMLESMGKYGGILLFLARYNAREAEHFAEAFASQIAADMLKTYIEQLLRATEIATGDLKDEPSVEEARRILADAHTRIRLDYDYLSSKSGESANRMLQYYDMTRRSALDALAVTRPTVGQR